MEWKANWLKPGCDMGDVVPLFHRAFTLEGSVKTAVLHITALGVYEASLNNTRVGKFILAPGWTAYDKRLQVQRYNVTALLTQENRLEVLVGKGWYRSPMMGWENAPYQQALQHSPAGLLAQLEIQYTDGRQQYIVTDENWRVSESPVRFSEIYDGECYDATFIPTAQSPVTVFDGPFHTLIPQEGAEVQEQEKISPLSIFYTPTGECIVDFGQNLTGSLRFHGKAKAGEILDLSFAEVLDKDGNFYNRNYRGAKARYHYICKEGDQYYQPKLTFYGFRYIRINAFPGGLNQVRPKNLTAVVIHSKLKRRGWLSSSHPMLNRLFDNCIWGQKGNFLDVPTDCPQRDERMGWTGDAQVFIKTACLNFDTEQFFTKWLGDLSAHQRADGYVGHVIPDYLQAPQASAAWGDAATICPWELYLAFGNPAILRRQFASMKAWVDYITGSTTTPNLWTGGSHYGDWLGLDAPAGSYKGSSREDFIASAYYAYSTSLVVKAGKVLEEPVSEYEALYRRIVTSFRQEFSSYYTQTECVLAAHFRLAENPRDAAKQLRDRIIACGTRLQTGFVGTPYLLHVLSDYGHTDLAYQLLLREDYPSWLYPITKDATTIWEHWDGIMENGDFWSENMNSFNHYAYGAVLDWIYTKAAGINTVENAPGYQKLRIAPNPNLRLNQLRATLKTARGTIVSSWQKDGDLWRYTIITPVRADIIINGKTETHPAGCYVFHAPQM